METRPLYGLERVWLAADRVWSPFVNQQVLEGEGPLDPARWRAAVTEANAAWPAARARLTGSLSWTRWVDDGDVPAVVEADAWDGRGPAPFLERRLDPWEGRVAEVVLVHGAPPRVVLRTHHAAFDGAAAAAWATDLAAALDGRPLLGGPLAGPLDIDLAPKVPPSPEPPRDRRPPTGAPTSTSLATTWRRVTIADPGHDVLAGALTALADAARAFDSTPLRVAIPVDLRRAHPEVRATGNLTGFVHLDLSDPRPLRAVLDAGVHGGPVHAAHKLRAWPLVVMEAAGRASARVMLTTGRCAVSATLSNLGRQPAFRGGGFEATRAWWIPPGGTPLFLTLSGHAGGLELCGTAPVGLADNGRLETLLNMMATAMEREPEPLRQRWSPPKG